MDEFPMGRVRRLEQACGVAALGGTPAAERIPTVALLPHAGIADSVLPVVVVPLPGRGNHRFGVFLPSDEIVVFAGSNANSARHTEVDDRRDTVVINGMPAGANSAV